MYKSRHVREARAIFVLIAFLLACCVAFAVLSDSAESNRAEVFECGKASGLYDSVPGYHVIRHAEYLEYEDGSGQLMCGNRVMVRVNVPW
jgi:hypothetical protein